MCVRQRARVALTLCGPCREGRAPWALSFSFGRALQASVLQAWGGKDENKTRAQEVAEALAKVNAAASQGHFSGPHPSLLSGSLHETFRGWSAAAPGKP